MLRKLGLKGTSQMSLPVIVFWLCVITTLAICFTGDNSSDTITEMFSVTESSKDRVPSEKSLEKNISSSSKSPVQTAPSPSVNVIPTLTSRLIPVVSPTIAPVTTTTPKMSIKKTVMNEPTKPLLELDKTNGVKTYEFDWDKTISLSTENTAAKPKQTLGHKPYVEFNTDIWSNLVSDIE